MKWEYIDISCYGKQVGRQCRALSIRRSSLYYEPKGESAASVCRLERIRDWIVAGNRGTISIFWRAAGCGLTNLS